MFATLDTRDGFLKAVGMSFVKLDCGMLDSTLWPDREGRELFITALLMARPVEFREIRRQLEVRTLEETGFEVPPGFYGFVAAAGSGIIRRAGMEMEAGLAALERLGSPEPDSRTPDFEGRRLVRVDGGYVALNYSKYREKDHTSAERSRRYREKKFGKKGKKVKSMKQVRLENDGRERAFVDAIERGDETQADAIVDRTEEG